MQKPTTLEVVEIFERVRPQVAGVLENDGITPDYSVESLKKLEQKIRGTITQEEAYWPQNKIKYLPYILYYGDALTKLIPGAEWKYGSTPEETFVAFKTGVGKMGVRPFHSIIQTAYDLYGDSLTDVLIFGK